MTPQAAAVADAAVKPVLLREDAEGIATLILNRPAARNALSEAMLLALAESLTAIAREPAVRAIVIAANGPAFCAGHDLKELSAHRADGDRGRGYYKLIMESCATVMQQIVKQPQPVIAAVQGPATAAGCQLVASCDLAVASSDAFFATPGVNIGLFCSTPMVALSRNVPRKVAMEMLVTGEAVTAADALRLGLVNHLVAPGTARAEAMAIGRKVAAKSAHVLKLGKEAFYRQLELGLADAYSYTADVMVENMMARDAEEGISAFVEKRAPAWEDR